MSTIEITDIEDVQVGDLVTLEDRRSELKDGTFKPDPAWRLTGHVREVVDGLVAVNPRDGEPYGWSIRIGDTLYTVGYLSPGGEMWSYSLVSATREVPDDAEALRRSLEAAREGYRKEAADRRARDQRLGAEIDRLEAEAEQLRLEVVKYREVAERLRAARQAPTRKRIVDAMWPNAPESARAGMTHLDIVDRIHALFEQGDES